MPHETSLIQPYRVHAYPTASPVNNHHDFAVTHHSSIFRVESHTVTMFLRRNFPEVLYIRLHLSMRSSYPQESLRSGKTQAFLGVAQVLSSLFPPASLIDDILFLQPCLSRSHQSCCTDGSAPRVPARDCQPSVHLDCYLSTRQRSRTPVHTQPHHSRHMVISRLCESLETSDRQSRPRR